MNDREPNLSQYIGPSAPGRLRFLDVARALAVVAMLVANLVNELPAERPYWLGHNLGDALLPLDLAAPMFQFLIGVSLALFLERHRSKGDGRGSRLLAARRFVVLIVLGAVLDGVLAHRLELRWGVLQTLGIGGLLAVAVTGFSDAFIIGLAALITATHLGPGNNEVHRSLSDCVPFLAITLLGYVVGRPLARHERARYEQRAIAVAFACLVLSLMVRMAGVPFNKLTGSSSFVLLSTAASATFIAALSRLEARGWRFSEALVQLGASALTAWVLQYLLVYYPIDFFVGHSLALSEGIGLVAVASCVVALSAATVALARRGIRLSL